VKRASPPTSKPASQGKTVVSTADPSKWLWPTSGRILSTFRADDPARNGIEIAGEEGQAIVAAAAGEVVYSGSGLIGYGELIIIKHSDRLLSAYAHNRKRLVAEGQAVSAGEKIAEMGRDDRNRTMLHFEIRSNGSPQDPQKFLPKR
jgi:lipoprotein NlpD